MVLVNQLIPAFSSSAMGLNATLEKNFSWMAFPGLIRAIVMLQCVVFAVILIEPGTANYFVVTSKGIAAGEYWRLISWIFFPFVSPFGQPVLAAFFMFIVLRIAFLFSDSLENAWGEVRTSFYVYATLACQALAFYLAATGVLPFFDFSNKIFYLSLFFAFATLFPNFQFLLFFVLPVKIWIFAVVAAVGLVLASLSLPSLGLAYGLCFLPYLVWAAPRFWNWRKFQSQISARRAKFVSQSKGAQASTVHHCEICHRTEISDPELHFRVAADGEEYCLDHLDEQGNPRP